MKLKNITTIKFEIDNLSIEKTFFNPSHFKSDIDKFDRENSTFYSTSRYRNLFLGLKFYNSQGFLHLDVFSEEKLRNEDIISIKSLIRIVDIYSEFEKEFSDDEFITNSVKRKKGMYRVGGLCGYSFYQGLIISTFLQNATVQRTVSMCRNMLENYGNLLIFDGVELYSLWNPNELNASDEELRALKVGYRAKNILRITAFFNENDISETELRKLPTDKLEKQLLKIYGVGKQTVFYLLNSNFERHEYLKHIPLWERKILARYLFDQEMCDEKFLIQWFKDRYKNWCGFALEEIFIDIWQQHHEKPFDWLLKIQREKKK